MMDRRAFLGALGLLAAPRAAKAQPSRVLGILAVNSPLPPRFTPGFWERLGELGWLEGQNLRVEIRDASNDMSRVPDLATELVRLKVDMIVMDNGTAARQVVDKVTRTLPICTSGGDLPCRCPGGNDHARTGSHCRHSRRDLRAPHGASHLRALGARPC